MKKRRQKHKCQESDVCTCSIGELEPDWRCPVHAGYREYPPRCCICGRFMKISDEAWESLWTDLLGGDCE